MNIQILKCNPSILNSLILFFEELSASNEDVRFFCPHAFTKEEANNICNKNGKDLYYVICGNDVIGYGILRGMDDGYKNPTLGIAISRKHRGKGWSKTLMLFLHSVACEIGAEYIMLKVKKDNDVAISLYKKLGYNLVDNGDEFLIGRYYL